MIFLRGRIIGRLECGRTQLEVSEELGIAQSVISRLWQRFQDYGNVSRCYCQKKQTEHSIRPVSSALFSYRYDSSRQTVYGRLGHIDLYARRPVRCAPLTATHCRLRLTWSTEHALWTPQHWSCVMFSGESRFSLQSDSRRTLIWRATGTRYHQENTLERHRYGDAGWLIWGGIILGSRTDLHVQCVTMTGHIYRDVILEQHVRLFWDAIGAEFLFMNDNARPHRANIVDECLRKEDITRMDWPAYSSDLNPIEHVWDMLGRRIAARQPPPTCLPEFRRALLDEWCNIPQDQIDNLILSMPRRCPSTRNVPYVPPIDIADLSTQNEPDILELHSDSDDNIDDISVQVSQNNTQNMDSQHSLPAPTFVTERLISPRIPFMQIRRLRHVLGQFGIYGQVINVPIEVNTMVNSLPRNIDDDHSITVHIKRKKIHKSNYLCGIVNKRKIKAWLQHLKDSPLYTSYGITVDDSFFNGQDDVQDEIIYDEDGDNDISEQIPIDESLVAQQQTLMWNDEMYLTIAPGEGNVPVSLLFDEHAEELSFPQIYLGQFRTFRYGVNVTSFMMATSERSDRRGVTLSICYTWL
ncbi:transposable element Tcb1 transposase [Trichonephila clavipes]|nr:transposable element Tcb1 transposase [Trichonephila clavipes]